MYNNESTFTSAVIIGIWVLAILGWFLNIFQIADAPSITGFVILRVAGIFLFPLGSILGYF